MKRYTPLFLVFIFASPALSEPYIPQSDSQVLETLPLGASALTSKPPAIDQTAILHGPEGANKLRETVEFAVKNIEQGRNQADPRLIGYADAALQPWLALTKVPPVILVLKATILEHNHDFTGALEYLAKALKQNPQLAQAWLTRAQIFMTQGNYQEARHACVPLIGLTSDLVSTVCASEAASLSGEAEANYAILKKLVSASLGEVSAGEKIWVYTLLADIAERLGRHEEAEKYFHLAMSQGLESPYLLVSYADFLLDRNRAQEARDLLANKTRSDPVELRLTLAEKKLGKNDEVQAHIQQLEKRFAAGRLRGQNLHAREEAYFALRLKGDCVEGLKLAKVNWKLQREPIDLRLLAEAATQCKDEEAKKTVREWLTHTKLEDKRLPKLD